MKASVLALTLVVSTVQTVGWVECCCILICKHRNDPCSDCKKSPTPEPMTHADCCEKKTPAPAEPVREKRCSHVEGSSEVLSQEAPPPPVLFDLVLDLPAMPAVPAPAERHKIDALFCDDRGSPPPLHLLYSVLLI
jgi:hypothetical protein